MKRFNLCLSFLVLFSTLLLFILIYNNTGVLFMMDSFLCYERPQLSTIYIKGLSSPTWFEKLYMIILWL